MTALAAALAGLPAVGLPEVLSRAELQLRLDRKYLVPAGLLAELIDGLAGGYAALEIDGSRDFRYSSTYFDAPDLLTYRQHLQGRRRRFKIRTRSYLDSGECMFEVKLAGGREATDKRRLPYEVARREELTVAAREFLWDTLLHAYRANPPERLGPAATTAYRRATLVRRSGAGRVTLDTGLVCRAPGGAAVPARDDLVLVESKSTAADAPADRLLRRLGVRPLPLSKYCLAVAVLYPQVTANPWHRPLRRLFAGSSR